MCILISTEKEYQNKINNDPNKKNWSKLANLTLCEVILFNHRRDGKVSKMPMTAFSLCDTLGVYLDLASRIFSLSKNILSTFI